MANTTQASIINVIIDKKYDEQEQARKTIIHIKDNSDPARYFSCEMKFNRKQKEATNAQKIFAINAAHQHWTKQEL